MRTVSASGKASLSRVMWRGAGESGAQHKFETTAIKISTSSRRNNYPVLRCINIACIRYPNVPQSCIDSQRHHEIS